MSCPLGQESLDKLKLFIDACTKNTDLLSLPELSFFKNYIESLGGTIPQPQVKMNHPPPKPPQPEETTSEVDSEPESDIDLDNEGCVEPDIINHSQGMGDPDKEVTEEDSDKSDEKRNEAMREIAAGNFDKAIALYTEAIELNPGSGFLFAKRGQAYLKQIKPNACIRDCTRALELNPDSATGYKFRGRAYRLLGEWEKAAKDLRQACIIDFDEQIDEWLKEVTPNAKKIEQHNLKLERKKLEKEEKEKLERARKVREAHAKASATEHPQGGPPDDFVKLLQDPEIMAAFQDPEVAAAFSEITANPANFYKYQSNPKVMALVGKLSGKLASGGFPGFPGGFPGFGGAAPGGGGAAPPSFVPDDDNLD